MPHDDWVTGVVDSARNDRGRPGQLDLSGDWDSPQTNAEIADDFGIGA